ncbi:Protein of unknown function- DUF593 [Striga hermonthica]|uniref:GTD-binding domain-containing protein n=1 Tax=Striga hermonthica TaxID=68872 RepID=A0A9N7MP14_STRHE|nr:Protein of unknown function- DUF593 [Striga hermonthica]
MGDEAEIWKLKDALCAQQSLLEKLHNELEAEREASASAASEALSVILRLQREKAAVKLEGEQYKRLSDEKISHAQESLAITEDILHQKEMEIAALDCQLQAYRYKLLSIDFGNMNGILERQIDWERKTTDHSIDSQIRKLDARVKEMNLCDLYAQNKVAIVDENSAKNGVGVDFHCPRVLDVFEVPHMENDENSNKAGEDEEAIEDKKLSEAIDKRVNFEKELCGPSWNASSIECRMAVVEPFCRLNGTSEIVKVEKSMLSLANRDEELKLLKEIKESLNLLHEEIRVLKVKEDEPSLCALSEAMLYFWL